MKFEKFLRRSTEITSLIYTVTGKASQCNIERSTVRQLFMPLLKRLVTQCTTPELAEICSQGDGFDPDPLEYREQHIVTSGTNAWSAIFLSTCDSGLVLLQKIAVASLLSDVCEAIVAIVPENKRENGLMPIEIVSSEQIDEFSKLGDELTKKMKW